MIPVLLFHAAFPCYAHDLLSIRSIFRCVPSCLIERNDAKTGGRKKQSNHIETLKLWPVMLAGQSVLKCQAFKTSSSTPKRFTKTIKRLKIPNKLSNYVKCFLATCPKIGQLERSIFWHSSHGMKSLNRNMIMMASLNTVCGMHEHFDGCARLILWKKQKT